MSALVPKFIYLARRNPELSAHQFRLRWREHAAMGMRMPRFKNIWRYVQCDLLPIPLDVPDGCNGYDGIGMSWYRSQRARVAHQADREATATLARDQDEVFAERVTKSSMLAREIVLRKSAEASGKIVVLLRKKEGLNGDQFSEYCRTVRGPRLLGLPAFKSHARDYVQNVPISRDQGGEPNLDWDCIEEIGLSDDAFEQLDMYRIASQIRSLDSGTNINQHLIMRGRDVVLYAESPRSTDRS